jgi:hypothetical protein
MIGLFAIRCYERSFAQLSINLARSVPVLISCIYQIEDASSLDFSRIRPGCKPWLTGKLQLSPCLLQDPSVDLT